MNTFKRHGEIKMNGNTLVYNNNLLHNENGPSVILNNGTKFYYYNNKLHRSDGPAVIPSKKSLKTERDYYLFGNNLNRKPYYSFIKFVKKTQIKFRKKYQSKIISRIQKTDKNINSDEVLSILKYIY